VIPLGPSPRPAIDLDLLGRLLRAKQVDKCPGAEACAQVGGPDLVGVVRGRGTIASVRVKGDAAEIDLVRLYLSESTAPEALLALQAAASIPTGGPEPQRCTRLDLGALGSMCIDADRMAELGLASGYAMTAGALMTQGISEDQRARIAEAGKEESHRNIELANPARRVLDDGTLSVSAATAGLRVQGSWAITSAAQPGIEAAFAKETCAAGKAIGTELLPKLRQAFGDPGPDFAKPATRLKHVKEAGWAAFPILFARTWPNFVPWAVSELVPSSPELASAERSCVRVRDGRLEIEGATGPSLGLASR